MDPTQTTLMLAGLLLIMGAVMLPRLFRRFARRGAPRALPVRAGYIPTAAEEAQLAAARELVIQLDQVSSRAFARLDSKLRLMNRLIEDADVRLRRLEVKTDA